MTRHAAWIPSRAEPRAGEATASMGGLRGIDMFRKIPADLTSATTTGAILSVAACVEINQCDGCTRQFFTKSFLGDDAAVLALSSGEEPASPRHRAGVASMAWRTTR